MNVCLVQPGRDFSPSQLVQSPLKDAGLKPSEVDGFLAIQPADDPRRSYALSVAQAAGICPSYATDLAVGGATPVSMVAHADTPGIRFDSETQYRGNGKTYGGTGYF
jgi:hypothetical protein